MQTAEEYEFPVSPAQSRLLVLDQMNPGSAQYTVYAAFAVYGAFDTAAFGRSLDALVERHESLRTVFRMVYGEQMQVVAATASAEVRRIDDVAPADVTALLVAEAERPFDMDTGPLFRTTLVGVQDGSHRILFTAHHAVCDGWSLQIMLDELAGFYAAQTGGPSYQPPELPIQYPDYAAWQRDQIADGVYAEQVEHWRSLLHDAPRALALPTDLPRTTSRTPAGASERFRLSADTLDLLGRVGRDCGATRFMTLFAAFTVFLSRLSHQDDIVVGVPTSGRERPDVQGMVGMLANTLALRADLSGDPTFRDVLARVRALVIDTQPYQDAPLEAVVEALAPSRELSHDPVFQVMFAFDDETELVLHLPGLRVDRVDMLLDIAKFDLMLYVDRDGDELTARFEYRTDLLTAPTVRRWVRNFETLLAGLLARPDAPVADIEVLPADERHEILTEWNATDVAVPSRLVPDLIAERAAERPYATAVVCGEVQLTYRDLLERADRLAAVLRRRGVGPEVPVGLCLPRSAEMAVAVVAVLRAGGAYVPLDPMHPQARVNHMVTTSGTRLILATKATEERAAGTGMSVLLMDRDPADAAVVAEAEAPPASTPDPRNTAYILFTSGSTGTPKGVAVEHRAYTNLALAVRPQFPVSGEDRVLQFVSFGFDVAVSDFAFTFVAGAQMYIAEESERLGEDLYARLRDSHITYAFLPPSAAMSLPCPPGALPELRTIAVGGEACPAELVERWAHDRRVLDAYGPSEDTVYATLAVLTPGRAPVIGRPVANARAYVLDERLRPVPVGVQGEIYLAGAGLARGYVNRPGMTAERFLADPFGPPGARMYRTGDLGRYDADGVLDYLGRVDNQVKLHGFRVELGEIEAVLADHAQVGAAAAIVRQDAETGGERRLVGYVTGVAGAAAPSDSALRAWLGEHLPGYMVPEVFVVLEEMPTNRSGKIDRARLPAPPAVRPDLGQTYVAPRDDTERRLAEIWMRVLHLDRVGVHDNFFDLGGNSVRLLAVQAALRERSGSPAAPTEPDAGGGVGLVDLFRYPTIATLAAHLAGATQSTVDDDASRRGHTRRERLAAHRARKGAHR